MPSEFEFRVREAREAVETELRRLGRHPYARVDGDAPLADRLGPALCMAACGLLGGSLDAATSSAAAVELSRVVFGKGSSDSAEVEFGAPAQWSRGRTSPPVEALLQDPQRLNADAALRTLEVHAEMTREFAAGKQTIADWVKRRRWDVEQLEYVKVVCQTKAWTTFVAPLMCGVVVANASDERAQLFRRFAVLLGTASHIAREAEDPYGGPGRRSLPLLHAVHSAEPGLREQLVDALAASQPQAREVVRNTIAVAGSLAYTRAFARHLARQARSALEEACSGLPPSSERDFLDAAVQDTLDGSLGQ